MFVGSYKSFESTKGVVNLPIDIKIFHRGRKSEINSRKLKLHLGLQVGSLYRQKSSYNKPRKEEVML